MQNMGSSGLLLLAAVVLVIYILPQKGKNEKRLRGLLVMQKILLLLGATIICLLAPILARARHQYTGQMQVFL